MRGELGSIGIRQFLKKSTQDMQSGGLIPLLYLLMCALGMGWAAVRRWEGRDWGGGRAIRRPLQGTYRRLYSHCQELSRCCGAWSSQPPVPAGPCAGRQRARAQPGHLRSRAELAAWAGLDPAAVIRLLGKPQPLSRASALPSPSRAEALLVQC